MISADLPPRAMSVGSYAILGLAAAPDGREYFTAGFDGVRRWGIASAKERLCYRPYSGVVCWGVACSPDARYVLAGFGDLTVRLWDFATGNELRQLRGHDGIVTAVAFSPDGSRALTGSPDKTLRW
jgi:WD40 repeat protein